MAFSKDVLYEITMENCVAEKKYGSCLCGKVQYEIIGNLEFFYLCHCKRCRKDTGSAYASNIFSKAGELRWVRGHESVKKYQLPKTKHTKSFCKNCGSALPYEIEDVNMIVIPAGSLDSEVDIKPNANIFVSSKASWSHKLDGYMCFEKLPE